MASVLDSMICSSSAAPSILKTVFPTNPTAVLHQLSMHVCMMQILSGGALCQQIDSEEDDDQEAEAEDEVSCSHIPADSQATGTHHVVF